MTIDTYVEAIMAVGGDEYSRSETPDIADSITAAADFYKYFQFNHGAKTVGEALNVLMSGQVDKDTVRIWVEDGLAVSPMEFDAISIGYPDMRSLLQEVRDERINAILNKKKI
jgi:hypothetical protein